MGEAGEGVGLAAELEDLAWPGGGGGFIGVHDTDADGTDEAAGAEEGDVAVVFGARLLAGAGGVAGLLGFAGGAEGGLGGGGNLAVGREGDVGGWGFCVERLEGAFVLCE